MQCFFALEMHRGCSAFLPEKCGVTPAHFIISDNYLKLSKRINKRRSLKRKLIIKDLGRECSNNLKRCSSNPEKCPFNPKECPLSGILFIYSTFLLGFLLGIQKWY